MIKTHLEVRITNYGEDGNGCNYIDFLKKHQDVSLSKVQVLLKTHWNFFKKVLIYMLI